MTINTNIVVDFDGIVKNITPENGQYFNCEEYVTYEGSNVNNTTMTLPQGAYASFTLVGKAGNCCLPMKFDNFTDCELQPVAEPNPNTLQGLYYCKTKGKVSGITMSAKFNISPTEKATASWDPVIIIDEDPD